MVLMPMVELPISSEQSYSSEFAQVWTERILIFQSSLVGYDITLAS